MNFTDQYRMQHNASSIQWNDTLAEFAEGVVEDCKFEHSVRLSERHESRTKRRRHAERVYDEKGIETLTQRSQGGPYGENLGSGYESGGAAVIAWGNESSKYDFKAAEFRFVVSLFSIIFLHCRPSSERAAARYRFQGRRDSGTRRTSAVTVSNTVTTHAKRTMCGLGRDVKTVASKAAVEP